MRSRVIHFLFLLMLGISSLFACTPRIPPLTENAVQTVSSPLLIPYCEVSAARICLVGFGQDGSGNLLILLKTNDLSPADLSVVLEKASGNEQLKCQPIEGSLQGISCLAGRIVQDTKIKMDIYSGDLLIAKGTFIVQYDLASLSTATPGTIPTHTVSPTFTLTPSYPGPSYPGP